MMRLVTPLNNGPRRGRGLVLSAIVQMENGDSEVRNLLSQDMPPCWQKPSPKLSSTKPTNDPFCDGPSWSRLPKGMAMLKGLL